MGAIPINTTGTKKRVFIFEDNPNNRAIMQLLLEHMNITVSFERWGSRIVERLRAFAPIDLILMDLMFPNEVSGYDLFDLIRAEADLADIPIIAVSAADASQAIPKTRSKGFNGFIAKPIELDKFPQYIAQALDKKPVWIGG
ncbi:MAG: hypothetical protein OHK0023_00980 [Anaerolineae bacterium]